MSEFHWEIDPYSNIVCSLPLTEGDLTKAADYWDGTDAQYDEITESVTLTILCPIPIPRGRNRLDCREHNPGRT